MTWFRQNRWLGSFLIIFGIATLLSLVFLWRARNAFAEASGRFEAAAAERNRLERLDPFPSDTNYEKMKFYLEDYSAGVDKMKEDLKTRMLPIASLAPNEFQSRLRQVTLATMEKARTNKVQLPRTFYMGFEEFASSLPSTAAAPLLGQELSQIALLMNTLIDARVDSVTVLKRTKLPEEGGPVTSSPAPGPSRRSGGAAVTGGPVFERNIVDFTFIASSAAARKVLNQIVSSGQQFYIIRTLYVRNEKEKGPPREGAEAAAAAGNPNPSASPGASPAGALKFIVGNEHIQTSLRVEMLRFKF